MSPKYKVGHALLSLSLGFLKQVWLTCAIATTGRRRRRVPPDRAPLPSRSSARAARPPLTPSSSQGGGDSNTSTSVGEIVKIMTETGPAGSITVQASEDEPRYDIVNSVRFLRLLQRAILALVLILLRLLHDPLTEHRQAGGLQGGQHCRPRSAVSVPPAGSTPLARHLALPGDRDRSPASGSMPSCMLYALLPFRPGQRASVPPSTIESTGGVVRRGGHDSRIFVAPARLTCDRRRACGRHRARCTSGKTTSRAAAA
jgi:hypothetical protein